MNLLQALQKTAASWSQVSPVQQAAQPGLQMGIRPHVLQHPIQGLVKQDPLLVIVQNPAVGVQARMKEERIERSFAKGVDGADRSRIHIQPLTPEMGAGAGSTGLVQAVGNTAPHLLSRGLCKGQDQDTRDIRPLMR
jgi:hypothetical protein